MQKMVFSWVKGSARGKHFYGFVKNANDAFRQEFSPPPNIGDWLKRERMSYTLEEIASSGFSSFYREKLHQQL